MAQASTRLYQPQLTDSGLSPTHQVTAYDEYGDKRELHVAGEFPLTLKVDGQEIVTLMTLGSHPEELSLGYLRNQRLIESIEEVRSVSVDWERDTVYIDTVHGNGIVDWEKKRNTRTVTTGCGQGTVFSCTLDKLYDVRLPQVTLRQSLVYSLLKNISDFNEVYRQAGAVHGCALCQGEDIQIFIEDVGRHNAADAISGRMWLQRLDGADKIFYTTGRLTSEIVMKAAFMQIPVLLSRSGVTHMGLELAQELGVMMLARAKGRHFLVYNGHDRFLFDDIPEKRKAHE
ncbi:MAG: formate dehydrogenase accessory sulfurtransferase FdhD [Acidiferrobacterales bacterium]|jgi:FdhD protein|nr:formate dehydrogenase accessory sulfurtransferase FdhD [Acidiferrobacterales bacterium]